MRRPAATPAVGRSSPDTQAAMAIAAPRIPAAQARSSQSRRQGRRVIPSGKKWNNVFFFLVQKKKKKKGKKERKSRDEKKKKKKGEQGCNTGDQQEEYMRARDSEKRHTITQARQTKNKKNK